MFNLVIDKGIEFPPYSGAGRPPDSGKYAPIGLTMDIGDSIFFLDRKDATNFHATMQKTCKRKNNGFVYSTRAVEGGFRVWRIK